MTRAIDHFYRNMFTKIVMSQRRPLKPIIIWRFPLWMELWFSSPGPRITRRHNHLSGSLPLGVVLISVYSSFSQGCFLFILLTENRLQFLLVLNNLSEIIRKAFDRVWHIGLLLNLKTHIPSTFYLILHSYLSERFFQVRQGSAFPITFQWKQKFHGVVSLVLSFIHYTRPTHSDTVLAAFADGTAILSSNPKASIATQKLQTRLKEFEQWYKILRIELNASKCQHITFSLRHTPCPSDSFNNTPTHVQNRLISEVLPRLTTNLEPTQNSNTRNLTDRQFGQLSRLLSQTTQLTVQN